MIEVGNSGCKRFCRCNDCKVVFLDEHEYGKPDNNFIELLNFLKMNGINVRK